MPPGGSASSPSLSNSHPITPETLAKTTPPSGSASSLSPSSSSSTSGGQSSGKRNVISQFLPPLPTVTPSRSSNSKQGGACVRTVGDNKKLTLRFRLYSVPSHSKKNRLRYDTISR